MTGGYPDEPEEPEAPEPTDPVIGENDFTPPWEDQGPTFPPNDWQGE